MAVTFNVAATRINMAARVIAMIRIVVRMEARISFMETREARPAATKNSASMRKGGGSPRDGLQRNPDQSSATRIESAGIRRIVLDAGGLAGNQTLEAYLPFQAGDVLCGVIRHAGNRVTVGNQMPRAQIAERLRACLPKVPRAALARIGGMLGEFDDLPFGDAANLIQVQAGACVRPLPDHPRDGKTRKRSWPLQQWPLLP